MVLKNVYITYKLN